MNMNDPKKQITIEFDYCVDVEKLCSKIVYLIEKNRLANIEDKKISKTSITLQTKENFFIDDAISIFYMLKAEGFLVLTFCYSGIEATKLKIIT